MCLLLLMPIVYSSLDSCKGHAFIYAILVVSTKAPVYIIGCFIYTVCLQVEELLDLFLGVGAPWPPESRQARTEHTREAPAYVEDTSSRAFTIEAASRPRLEEHRESTYASRCAIGILHRCM